MKFIMKVVMACAVTVFALAISFTICGRGARTVELKDNLAGAAESTVENLVSEKGYAIANRNEFLADFIEDISYDMVTDSTVSVKVMALDIEKGLLSVRVEEKYKNPNGKESIIPYTSTVIYNKTIEHELENYQISFYLSEEDLVSGGESYKDYVIQENAYVTCPVEPKKAGKVFAGWKDKNGNTPDFSQPITEDMSYYAIWN